MRLKRISGLLIAIAALFMTTVSAQGGMGMGGGMSGGMGGMGGGSRGPMPSQRAIDPIAMTGYFEFDIDRLTKKIKVTDAATKTEIRKVMADFLIASGDVYNEYQATFADLEILKDIMKEAQEGGSPDMSQLDMKTVMEGSRAIRKEMIVHHKDMQANMEALLADNEKSLSRWKLYYDDICDSHNFTTEDRPMRGQRGQRGEGDEEGRPEGGPPEGGMGGPGGGGMGGF